MGHIMPSINIADEMVQRGHDVSFITNGYNKEKCLKQIEEIPKNSKGQGCTPIFTEDGLSQKEFLPKGIDKWTPFIEDEIKKL